MALRGIERCLLVVTLTKQKVFRNPRTDAYLDLFSEVSSVDFPVFIRPTFEKRDAWIFFVQTIGIIFYAPKLLMREEIFNIERRKTSKLATLTLCLRLTLAFFHVCDLLERKN